jgi:hypothetical protein
MNMTLKAALAVIESMLADVQVDHADELFDHHELSTSLQMAYRQVSAARIKYSQVIEQGKMPAPVITFAPIRLTSMEKWVLRSISGKPEGIHAKMLRAEHDRLISNQLIAEENGSFFITQAGVEQLEHLIKLPGSKSDALTIRK